MNVYSFLNTVIVVNGVEITGWSEGDDVIDIKRLVDSATHKVGADGNMMVSLSADRSGEFTFKLQMTSSSNAYLDSLLAQQENGADTFEPITVLFQDTFRNDRGQASAGYIKKPSDLKRGVTGGDHEWTIVVENLVLQYGNPGS
jgi:hypothetical protein